MEFFHIRVGLYSFMHAIEKCCWLCTRHYTKSGIYRNKKGIVPDLSWRQIAIAYCNMQYMYVCVYACMFYVYKRPKSIPQNDSMVPVLADCKAKRRLNKWCWEGAQLGQNLGMLTPHLILQGGQWCSPRKHIYNVPGITITGMRSTLLTDQKASFGRKESGLFKDQHLEKVGVPLQAPHSQYAGPWISSNQLSPETGPQGSFGYFRIRHHCSLCTSLLHTTLWNRAPPGPKHTYDSPSVPGSAWMSNAVGPQTTLGIAKLRVASDSQIGTHHPIAKMTQPYSLKW